MAEVPERFYTKFSISDTGCWVWHSAQSNGYGRFKWQGRQWTAHKFAYTQFKGEVPAKYEVDHLCRNRACCNPEHLEAVSHKVNQLRGQTIIAENVAKTHCKHGHEYTPETLYTCPRGRRECRICRAASVARYKQGASVG